MPALICMTRPSDLAPKGVISSCAEDIIISPIVLGNIDFPVDGLQTINFWGIKNDSSRSGFEVNIPPNSNSVLDPVKCVKDYIDRTQEMRPSDTKPLFISLKKPYKTLKSDTIGHILEETIMLVGLYLQLNSPLGYRGYSSHGCRSASRKCYSIRMLEN